MQCLLCPAVPRPVYEQPDDKKNCDGAKRSEDDDMPWVKGQKNSSAVFGCFYFGMMGINFYLFDLITIVAIKFQKLGEYGYGHLGFPQLYEGKATIFCRSSSHIFSRIQERPSTMVSGAFACSAGTAS